MGGASGICILGGGATGWTGGMGGASGICILGGGADRLDRRHGRRIRNLYLGRRRDRLNRRHRRRIRNLYLGRWSDGGNRGGRDFHLDPRRQRRRIVLGKDIRPGAPRNRGQARLDHHFGRRCRRRGHERVRVGGAGSLGRGLPRQVCRRDIRAAIGQHGITRATGRDGRRGRRHRNGSRAAWQHDNARARSDLAAIDNLRPRRCGAAGRQRRGVLGRVRRHDRRRRPGSWRHTRTPRSPEGAAPRYSA